MTNNNTFDFANFRMPPVEREYLPHNDVKEGQGPRLFLNLYLLTVEKMEEIEANFEEVYTELVGGIPPESDDTVKEEVDNSAILPKISMFHFEKVTCRFRARMLGGAPGEDNPDNRLIHSWNVVADGIPVPVRYETFIKMSKAQIDHLYNFVTGEALNPTKKNDSKSANT